MKEKPLILVTNDDGITAPGIRKLIEVMNEIGEVVVVAPDSPQSGMGHAITVGDKLRLVKSDLFGDIESYKCSGTPADCVKIAKHHILKNRNIDLIASGINLFPSILLPFIAKKILFFFTFLLSNEIPEKKMFLNFLLTLGM